MQALNLPPIKAKIINDKGKKSIFDLIRNKYVSLTPEEWVRQHFIHFLINMNYPPTLMCIEKLVVVNNLKQRADIVVYNKTRKPVLIVECKAPSVKLTNETLEQAARYNIPLGVDYLVITNGISSYCIHIDKTKNTFNVLAQLPSFNMLNTA